jgi:predicted DsbA family dithiol-disulfide isomerase
MKIEIYSDIACPWCYIGKRRLESALAKFEHRDEVEIEWKSFELEPERPTTLMGTHAKYFAESRAIPEQQVRKMEKQTEEIASNDGIDMRFDVLKLFNTRNAHQLLHFAKELGMQGELEERFFRATFTEGRQLGDVDELVSVAVEVGLPEDGSREALASQRYLAAVIDDELQASGRGARGVPFYVFNGTYTTSGAQSPEVFLQTLNRTWKQAKKANEASAAESGSCGPDSCTVR